MRGRFINIVRRFSKINPKLMKFFYLAIFMIILENVIVSANSIILGRMVDSIRMNTNTVFIKFMIALCLLEVVKLPLKYAVTYLVNWLSETSMKNMREYTYKHVTNAAMRWLDESKLGDILSRVNGDLNELVSAINELFTWEISSVISCLVSLIVCICMNWKLSLLSFIILPIIGILQAFTGKPIAKLGEKRSIAEGQASAVFQDLLGGMNISKAFAIEDKLFYKYNLEVDKAVDANVKSFATKFLMQPLQMLMNFLPTILMYAIGSYFVLHGDMTLGALVAFTLLATKVLNPITALSYMLRNLYVTVGIAERIYSIWDVEIETAGGDEEKKGSDSPVSFRKVSFGYQEENEILHKISFEIAPGEQVALVGASGCGKSTILKLIAGFYEKTDGDMVLFGHKIEEWNTKALRKELSYVGQDSYLFPGSIYDNVSLGNQDATRTEIEEVISRVGLSNLDCECEIGERGVLLSGGQRQRICIARALLKNASLVLLDEPTSALDTESEFLVNLALEELTKGKASIIIAHRLSTIKNVDRILCIEKGKIVEEGTHENLMRLRGSYYMLYQKQEKEVQLNEQ